MGLDEVCAGPTRDKTCHITFFFIIQRKIRNCPPEMDFRGSVIPLSYIQNFVITYALFSYGEVLSSSPSSW